ncbi:hypothetical protein AB6A40_005001 [Gnathostoma spinigerum]|uniref:Uncharacterized protein n=1 Tax=Gnathostoma spinigerum TaxID=75299 RepID=A0ABD6EP22_9BILA
MKEKDQTSVCIDQKVGATPENAIDNKEIVDDSCFKTPLLMPMRKGINRRRSAAVRNGQTGGGNICGNDDESSQRNRTSVSPIKTAIEEFVSRDAPNPEPLDLDSAACVCSSAYIASLYPELDGDAVVPVKEAVIDQFSLLLFETAGDLQAFQSKVDAEKVKELTEHRKRHYEESLRLSLARKKGRKSKAELEKEKHAERRRMRKEMKEERRRLRRATREGGGAEVNGEGVRAERKSKRSKEADAACKEKCPETYFSNLSHFVAVSKKGKEEETYTICQLMVFKRTFLLSRLTLLFVVSVLPSGDS